MRAESWRQKMAEGVRKGLAGLARFFKRVWAVCVWPLLAAVSVLEYVIFVLNAAGKALVRVSQGCRDTINTWIDRWDKKRKKAKKWREIIQVLTQIMVDAMPSTHTAMLGNVAGVLIILLQSISFLTTYGGTKYYFSDIAGWIPVVLAGVIQLTIVVFSLSLGTKQRNETAKKTVLALTVCVSILFSYVGVANSAIAPYEEYTQQYDTMYATFEALKNDLMNDPEVAYSPYAASAVIYDQALVSQGHYLLGSYALEQDIDSAEIDRRLRNLQSREESITQSAEGEITTIVSTGLSKDIERAIAENMIDTNQRAEIRTAVEELNDALKAIGVNTENDNGELGAAGMGELLNVMRDYATYLSEKTPTSQDGQDKFFETYTKYQNMVIKSNALLQVLGIGGEDTQAEDTQAKNMLDTRKEVTMLEFSNKLKAYKELEDLVIAQSDTIRGDGSTDASQSTGENGQSGESNPSWWNTLLQALRVFLPRKATTTETYHTIMDQYAKEAYKARAGLSKFAGESSDKNVKEQLESIEDSYDKFSNAPDATIVAFSRLFSPKTFSRMIVPAILAVIIDGGTLLISWGGKRRRYALLYANTNKDYFEEETDLFEQIFISAIQTENLGAPGENSDDDVIKKCASAVSKSISRVKDYLEVFKYSPETVEFGCSLIAPAEGLNKLGDAGLTSLLLSMGYLCPLSEQQHKVLTEDRFDPNASVEVKFYCLKFRAENYLRQCMTRTNLYGAI